MNAYCEGCGQPCLIDDAWTVRGLCGFCRARVVDGQSGKPERLFEPVPEPLPGQRGMDL